MAEFFASYGSGVDISHIKGMWMIEGPQERQHIPEAARKVFEVDSEATAVVVTHKGGGGYIIRRCEPEEDLRTAIPNMKRKDDD